MRSGTACAKLRKTAAPSKSVGSSSSTQHSDPALNEIQAFMRRQSSPSGYASVPYTEIKPEASTWCIQLRVIRLCSGSSLRTGWRQANIFAAVQQTYTSELAVTHPPARGKNWRGTQPWREGCQLGTTKTNQGGCIPCPGSKGIPPLIY